MKEKHSKHINMIPHCETEQAIKENPNIVEILSIFHYFFMNYFTIDIKPLIYFKKC